MAFLDDLSGLLGLGSPQPQAPIAAAGLTNYGAAPTPQGVSASPTAQILAQIKPLGMAPNGAGTSQPQTSQVQPGGGYNPLGLGTPVGGNDLAVALSGLRDVNSHASKFGAFAQGLAGAMGARSNANFQNQQLGLQQQQSGLLPVSWTPRLGVFMKLEVADATTEVRA